MNESVETSVPKKRYWHWVALGSVVLLAASLQLIPVQPSPGNLRTFSNQAVIDISTIMQSLTQYAINNKGSYPSSLEPLVTPDTNGNCYLEGYDRKIPRDPWKREYLYDAPTPEHPKPRVRSLGSDGKPGGSGTAADMDNESIRQESR